MNFYIARDGEALGPYTEPQVREYLKTQIFSPEELVCREGEENWQPLGVLFPPPPPRPSALPVWIPGGGNVPPAQEEISEPSPVQASLSGERTFYSDRAVTVTNARFIVHGQTYALRNIASVQNLHKPAERGGPILCIIFGLLMCLALFSDSPVIGFIGVALVVGGYVVNHSRRDLFTVMLTTNAGQVRAVEDQRSDRVAAIVQGLNEAIVSHGR